MPALMHQTILDYSGLLGKATAGKGAPWMANPPVTATDDRENVGVVGTNWSGPGRGPRDGVVDHGGLRRVPVGLRACLTGLGVRAQVRLGSLDGVLHAVRSSTSCAVTTEDRGVG